MNLRKTTSGNYTGWHNGFYLFFFKRPHGGWSCLIRKNWYLWNSEGYHSKSLPTIAIAKKWAVTKINANEDYLTWITQVKKLREQKGLN